MTQPAWLSEYNKSLARITGGQGPSPYWQREFSRLKAAAEDAQRLRRECGDEGNLVDIIELGKVQGRVEKPAHPKRLRDFTGMAFFTLGPVYTFCSVDRDMLEAFREMTTPDAHVRTFDPPRLALEFGKPVLQGCHNKWDYYLEAIPLEYVSQFKELVTSQRFRLHDAADYNKVTYWGANCIDRVIPDPLAVERNDYVPHGDDDCMIHVFLPSGNTYRLAINPMSDIPIELVGRPPDAQIVKEAAAILNKEGISNAQER